MYHDEEKKVVRYGDKFAIRLRGPQNWHSEGAYGTLDEALDVARHLDCSSNHNYYIHGDNLKHCVNQNLVMRSGGDYDYFVVNNDINPHYDWTNALYSRLSKDYGWDIVDPECLNHDPLYCFRLDDQLEANTMYKVIADNKIIATLQDKDEAKELARQKYGVVCEITTAPPVCPDPILLH